MCDVPSANQTLFTYKVMVFSHFYQLFAVAVIQTLYADALTSIHIRAKRLPFTITILPSFSS